MAEHRTMEVYLRLKSDNVDPDQAHIKDDKPNKEAFNDKTIVFHSNIGIGELNSLPDETFQFDKIFDDNVSQSDIASYFIPLIEQDLTNGINCSLITYGSNDTGKTYTLFGKHGLQLGLIPRLLMKLFQIKCENESSNKELNKDCVISFRISALDLLDSSNTIKDLLSNKDQHLTLHDDHMDGSYNGVWPRNANWFYCDTLEQLSTFLEQIASFSKGDVIIRLELGQMFVSKNLMIKSNLIIFDLKSFNERNNLHENFINMLTGKNHSYTVNNLNKLLYCSIFKNFNTRFILTCSLLPVLQNETLKTLQITKYLSNIVKDYIAPNKSWISPVNKVENLSNVIERKNENYEKQVELLRDTIGLLESKNNNNINIKRQEVERLILDNSLLDIEWKKLIAHNNNADNEDNPYGNNVDSKNEPIEIIIDKINTLFSHRLQLDTHIDANRQLHRMRNNWERIKTEFDIINSKLLDIINQQETKIQDYLNENMNYKRQLDHLKVLYAHNNDRIRSIENEILKNRQEQQPQNLRASHSAIASSITAEDTQAISSQNSGLMLTSTVSLTPSSSTSSTTSSTSSMAAAQSSTRIRTIDHLSQTGFHLHIIKPK